MAITASSLVRVLFLCLMSFAVAVISQATVTQNFDTTVVLGSSIATAPATITNIIVSISTSALQFHQVDCDGQGICE